MKTIFFSRTEETLNKNHQYQILQNGRILKNISFNKVEQVVIEETGELQVKLLWCGSKMVDSSEIKDGALIQIKANIWLNRRIPFLVVPIPLVRILLNKFFSLPILSSRSKLISEFDDESYPQINTDFHKL